MTWHSITWLQCKTYAAWIGILGILCQHACLLPHCVCVCVCVCICVCVCVCVCMCMNTSICACVCVCMCYVIVIIICFLQMTPNFETQPNKMTEKKKEKNLPKLKCTAIRSNLTMTKLECFSFKCLVDLFTAQGFNPSVTSGCQQESSDCPRISIFYHDKANCHQFYSLCFTLYST